MNFNVQSDKQSEMIAAILAGDTQLYHELIRPYERCVYIMALFYVKNEEDAEDVAQETFIRTFRNLPAFRGESKFGPWLIGIALNEAKKRLQRQASVRIAPVDEPPIEEIFVFPVLLRDWRELPAEILEHEGIRDWLKQAVERLPDICRQVFLLHDVEGLNVDETAEIVNISISLVKVRLHLARMMLQRLLAPQLKAISSASKQVGS